MMDHATRLCQLTPLKGRMLIDGLLTSGVGDASLECINPATEEVIGNVPRATAEDVDTAVRAAERAHPSWAELSVQQRAASLNRLADAIVARTDDLLTIEVADSGNTVTGMKGDIVACVERLRYFAGLGYELQGSTIPTTSSMLNFTTREPYGVVGRICAFNHPLAMAVNGMAAALMAGNALVIKPSEQCSLSAVLLGEICSTVLPPGLVNIVTGDVEAGNALVRHRRVKRLSFVGSVRTGMAIQRSAAEVAVKSLSLELGGKNPFIVFPDADVDRAATAAVAGMNFTWQGQSCNSTSRLFVHDAIYDAVVDRVVAAAKAVRVGDPFEPTTQMGAINTSAHLQRIEQYVRIGETEGAKLLAGGSRPVGAGFDRGFWFQPTVFGNVDHRMRVAQEEIFGPVMSILRWSDVDDVIEMANSVEYGLTAAIWTRDIAQALRTARRVQSGYIWINGIGAQGRAVPFGGYKNSGIGRERGLEELYSYTEEKAHQVFI